MAKQGDGEFKVADIPPSDPSGTGEGATVEEQSPSDGTHATTEQGSGEHVKKGLPQLDTSTFAGQLFWLFLTFGALYWVMSRVALPKLEGVLKARAGRIRGDLESAAEAKRASDAALANYERTLADARSRASKLGDDMRNQVQADATAKNDAAAKELAADSQRHEARIAEMRARAMSNLALIARDTAADIVQKLTGETATANELDSAISAASKRA